MGVFKNLFQKNDERRSNKYNELTKEYIDTGRNAIASKFESVMCLVNEINAISFTIISGDETNDVGLCKITTLVSEGDDEIDELITFLEDQERFMNEQTDDEAFSSMIYEKIIQYGHAMVRSMYTELMIAASRATDDNTVSITFYTEEPNESNNWNFIQTCSWDDEDDDNEESDDHD